MYIGHYLHQIRKERPLVHNITNGVVMNIAANALLSIGASPVMTHAHEEVADMAKISSGLSLNMGTVTPEVLTGMLLAGRSAEKHGVPIVFDPVGVGATPYRTEVAASVVDELNLTVLRANAGEMSVFLGLDGEVKGVDALEASSDLPSAMKAYAKENQVVLVATGPVDVVTDGDSVWSLANGHPLLAAITGSGCMLTALLGAFIGVVPKGSELANYAEACVSAVTCYNVAAELASKEAKGPGTFHALLFNALYRLRESDVEDLAKISREAE